MKFFAFIAAMILLSLVAIAIYLSSPHLINSTLPYVLDTDEPERPGQPRFVMAMSEDELIERYGYPSADLQDIYYFAAANQLKALHNGQQQTFLEAGILGDQIPSFDDSWLGIRYVLIEYPDECMQMAVTEHKWIDHIFVVEVSCYE